MRLSSLLIALVLACSISLAVWALRGRFENKQTVAVLPVSTDDREIAWFHTSTNGVSWERFVAGVNHACRTMEDVTVDDSHAFLSRTTAIPEVVISWKDRPGKLRFRWYKQSNETGTRQWIDALAERDPAPLAIIGGGSSDRALDLARALTNRDKWTGRRPLLLMTTATANEIILEGGIESHKLTDVYPKRSFRFCFTNEQMARAVVDFVWSRPDLRPEGKKVNGVPIALPTIFSAYWLDDPYSEDLNSKFWRAISEVTKNQCDQQPSLKIGYSVGSFDRVNASEAIAADTILDELEGVRDGRSLLVLPAGTNPARRLLRALAGESPTIGRRLVAVNGDSISINDVYRDGSQLWNMRDVPVPLVFFSQQNPIGWDDDLPQPAGTDEVLLFAKMVEVLVGASRPTTDTFVEDSDALLERIRTQQIVPFDEDGNRKDGEEYIVCLRPEISDAGRIGVRASLEVWRRSLLSAGWEKIDKNGPLRAPYVARPNRRP